MKNRHLQIALAKCPKALPAFLIGFGFTGCQVPKDLSVLNEPHAVRLPSSLIGETYEPKSKAEESLDANIANEAEVFLGEAASSQAQEKVSSVAGSFANSGTISRESWWAGDISRPVLATTGKTVQMGLDEIYQRALAHSSQIKVFAALPLIRETAIDEAKGEFDPEIYTQNRYDRTHEPTGSVLETGNDDDYFKEKGWTSETGIRKRFMPGTQVSLAQELSQVSNNSEFFSPDDQGRSKLKLSVMQPLLRGAGTKYNRTLIQIAKLDAEAGYDEFIRQLETHLMEVNRTYWSLYLARAAFVEKKRLVKDTESVVSELDSRGNLDSIASQRSRARSALATRKADLIRSELAIKNAESRLRTLVNDPIFVDQQIGEVIPGDLPITSPVVPEFSHAVAEALAFRPEIKQAENHLRAADLREYMANNEKLPNLNVIGEVGISALRGEGDWSGAYGDQYDDGEPTWGVGLVASMPWGRKSAKARHLRTELEARQISFAPPWTPSCWKFRSLIAKSPPRGLTPRPNGKPPARPSRNWPCSAIVVMSNPPSPAPASTWKNYSMPRIAAPSPAKSSSALWSSTTRLSPTSNVPRAPFSNRKESAWNASKTTPPCRWSNS